MRNWFDNGCDCSNPEPIVGAIVGGKKFPFGTVKQSDYDADMKEVNENFKILSSKVDYNNTTINNKVDANTTAVNHKFDDVEGKINAANDRISTANTGIAALNDKVAGVKSDTAVIGNKVDSARSDITQLQNGKVDKVAGKGLSTNDYTNADREKVYSNNSEIEKLKSYFTEINALGG